MLLTDTRVAEIEQLISDGKTAAQIKYATHVDPYTIKAIRNGERHTCAYCCKIFYPTRTSAKLPAEARFCHPICKKAKAEKMARLADNKPCDGTCCPPEHMCGRRWLGV